MTKAHHKIANQPSEKILIVDDNQVNRQILTTLLRKEGYTLLEAKDGDKAVKIAAKELPDLILLDIMMPKKDGYQVCSELKNNEKTSFIPIIFLSAKTDVKDKVKGFDLGGADYVTKPFHRKEVLARTKAHLKIQSLTRQLIKTNEELKQKQDILEEDLRAAADIQKSLLPSQIPKTVHLDISYRFEPCQKIGGDLINIIPLDEETWVVYVFDVSGHGVPAAMVGVSVSQVLRSKTERQKILMTATNKSGGIRSPKEILEMLDKEFPIERFGKFFTISYLLLNLRKRRVIYSNAAHPYPILIRKNGEIEFLEAGGTVIGAGGVVPFEEGEKQMYPGDKIFVYTDGIVEYRNSHMEQFGLDRLCTTIMERRKNSVSIIIDEIINSIMQFGNNHEPTDDISLLGLEFK
jgi:sigma-B regulation protein RsbU (phosphoserine phosphatase)